MIKKTFTFFLLAILAMVGYAFFTGIFSNTFFRLPAITLGGITFFAVIGLIFGFLVYGKHKVRPITTDEWYTMFKNRSYIHPVSYGSLFDDDDD